MASTITGPRGYVVGVDEFPGKEEKEQFQATLIQLGGTVTGSKGRGYLNYLTLGGGTPGQAFNLGRVQERAGVPVWVSWFKDEPVIMHVDKSRMEPNGARGYRSPLFAQHAPDHGWGSGDPDYVDSRRIKELMVRPAGEFKVNISPGRYGFGGEYVYFPGQQNYDLAAYQPAVAGTKRKIGLYLDSANTIQVVEGGLLAVTAVIPELDWPSGAFRLISFILFESKDFIDFEYIKQEKVIWSGSGGAGAAAQAEVDAGLIDNKYVSPLTLKSVPIDHLFVSKISNPADNSAIWEIDGSGNLINVGSSVLDLNGTGDGLVLDSDGDTTIAAPLDDIIEIKVNGTDAVQINTSGITIPGGTMDAQYVSGHHVCEGRLTLTTGTAVTTADAAAATVIYFTPFRGNRIDLYTGSLWKNFTFTERSLSLSGFTAGKNNDVFIYDNAGTLTLERVEWTNDTTRATALALQDGVLVKSGATTRRYLGTFRTTASTGQTEDSTTHRYCWNYYHRVKKNLTIFNGSNHTYDSTWRAFNNDQANSDVEIVVGVVEEVIEILIQASLTFVAGGSSAQIGPGLNSLTSPLTQATFGIAGTLRMDWIGYKAFPALGYNYIVVLEQGGNTGADPSFNNCILSVGAMC